MDVHQRYDDAVRTLSLEADPAQRRAIGILAGIAHELSSRPQAPGLLGPLRRLLPARAPEPVRGAYLWGGVGRGKTFMLDLFFASLPFPDKARYHFHRVMSRVHSELKALHQEQDPLAVVAARLAAEARVLCFDEFYISDIADAMLLGRLLDALFTAGVTLVATSNTAPADLYRGGLQRQRFLPAIALLEQHTQVEHVDGLTDYRLRVLEAAEIWHAPLDEAAEHNLERYFSDIASGPGDRGRPLNVLGREVPTRRLADGVAWFDFQALCEGPRSAGDYIQIARSFQTVLLSGVPRLDEAADNAARRFIALVDEFYDRRVNLIVAAAVPINQLYGGFRLTREFERTRSRLLEMQSVEYLAAAHLP